MMAALRAAFAMFSAIPMPVRDWDAKSLRYLICALPAVGLLIGGLEVGWLWLAARFDLPELVRAAFAVVIPIAVSGGIHLDGFCDTVDALASRAEREKKQAILKDPHLGAFAAIYLAAYLLLYFALAAALPYQWNDLLLFALSFVLSRACGGLAVLILPPFKQEGLGHTFAVAAAKRRAVAVMVGEIVVCGLAALWLNPWIGALMLVGCALAFWVLWRLALRQFGGLNGDLAGWLITLCELIMLAVIVVTAYFV